MLPLLWRHFIVLGANGSVGFSRTPRRAHHSLMSASSNAVALDVHVIGVAGFPVVRCGVKLVPRRQLPPEISDSMVVCVAGQLLPGDGSI
jgi:hypothetical protein